EGDHVAAGRTIAEVTGDDVRFAARSESTDQRYRSAKRDLDSKQALFDQGLISELELRSAEDAFVDAKFEMERSKLTLARSTLVTPISGVVLSLARDERNQPIAEGQLVTQGQVIAQVAPLGTLVADVDLIGSDIARVRKGLSATVVHHAWPDEPFEGRVRRIAPSIDPTTRALRAEVEIANRGGRLRPGMFVDVSLIVDRRDDVSVVPRRAVVERGGRKVVFVVKGQKVQETEVRLGFGDDDIVEVVDGLEPGDRVVITGLETLTDEASVRVTGS
ncbi:MAG: efflux RND transporter periplasmic adaptor subunit, partial [Planctomycetota bacterium]|nr:efflux RND transporter periplasmic adaptor subunit [Planctomycetota bacterium]